MKHVAALAGRLESLLPVYNLLRIGLMNAVESFRILKCAAAMCEQLSIECGDHFICALLYQIAADKDLLSSNQIPSKAGLTSSWMTSAVELIWECFCKLRVPSSVCSAVSTLHCILCMLCELTSFVHPICTVPSDLDLASLHVSPSCLNKTHRRLCSFLVTDVLVKPVASLLLLQTVLLRKFHRA